MNRLLFTSRRQFDGAGSREAPLIAALDAYDTRQDSLTSLQTKYSAVIGLIGSLAVLPV